MAGLQAMGADRMFTILKHDIASRKQTHAKRKGL
jgi:hypothetical protein